MTGSDNPAADADGSDVVHVEGVVEGHQVQVGVDPPEGEAHALSRGLLVVTVPCNSESGCRFSG